MLIFDTLSELESYQSIIPYFSRVIDILDHSTPYDNPPGVYKLGEDEREYIVDTYLSSANGFIAPKYEKRLVLEICLEGDEIVAVGESVFKLIEGRFLLYSGSEEVKRGVAYSAPKAFKAVRFIL